MNKQVLFALGGVIILGVIGVIAANVLGEPDVGGTELRIVDQGVQDFTPAVQPVGNTFSIMSPEEAAEARAAAEQARLAAESATGTATSSNATSTDEREELSATDSTDE